MTVQIARPWHPEYGEGPWPMERIEAVEALVACMSWWGIKPPEAPQRPAPKIKPKQRRRSHVELASAGSGRRIAPKRVPWGDDDR